jgi:hypothetical protein
MEKNIQKGQDAEKFAYNLSRDKLLEKYCFLNPSILNSDNKEICDLLILTVETCIIISIKNYSFSGNYERFEKQVFEKSKKQLLGAKRKLGLAGKCTLIDKNRKEQGVDFSKIKTYILITLNFGHKLDLYKMLEYEKENVIHNIDKDSFETIIYEIDSIPEVIEYFTKKEILFSKSKTKNFIGEEKDLLAYFVTHKREFPKEWMDNNHDFVMIDIEGTWDDYNNHEQTLEKRKANKISYFVDDLIKKEISKLPQCGIISDYLSTLNRTERRLFAMTFFEHYTRHEAQTDNFLSRRYIPNLFHDESCLLTYYITSDDDNSIDRILILTSEIYLYKYRMHTKKIVTISTTKDYAKFKFGYMERIEEYTKEEIDYYEEVIKNVGYFTSHKYSHIGTQEYPEIGQ